MYHGRDEWRAEIIGEKPCPECGTVFAYNRQKNKFCSRPCASRSSARNFPRRPARISPLTVACDTGDNSVILAAIRDECAISGSGCWLWPRLNKNGYPIATSRGKARMVHRIAFEAHTGASLGGMDAHHTCGTSSCVNPEHVVPATRRENIAEMLERRSLRARIADLEAALREVAPDHPLVAWSGHLEHLEV